MSRFYFAWVDATETTWGPEHLVEDEVIKSLTIEHKEGGIPTLSIDIRNPGIGLLAGGRQKWAWVSYDDGDTITPLMFGQVLGMPSDLFGEVVTLQFTARALDYEEQKQNLAETLKVSPWYDPIFLSPEERDNPDRILEAYSGLWHVDRTSLEVTVSDVLLGEDALEVFTEADVPYDSVTCQLAQTPLRSVTVNANVTWTQTATGQIDISPRPSIITTLTGDGLISGWPKPLSSLGGGWSAAQASAIDLSHSAAASTATYTSNYQNKEKEHENGDTLSINASATVPTGPIGDSRILSAESQIGFFDPYADPQVNIPASSKVSIMYVVGWRVGLTLIAQYDAKRQRSERIKFTLNADLQDILSDPEAADNTDVISISGADVGQPILNLLNWVTVEDSDVVAGQEIIGHSAAGEISYQVATVGGHTGASEPNFSTLTGVTTVDGGVTWTSMGTQVFATNIPVWVANDTVAAGEIIHPIGTSFVNWTTILPPVPTPMVGASVALGLIIKRSSGTSYQQVTQAGTTGLVEPAFSDVRGVVTTDNGVEWTSLGAVLPGSADYQLATGGGITGALQPAFTSGVGSTTLDGSVTWTSIGPNGGFIGSPLTDLSRRSYFPTDRGLLSIEYLLSIARAHLRYRSRAIEVTFECRFERAIAFSCRKMARLFDHRFPGGMVTGKIIGYSLKADGPTGALRGSVTIGLAIGTDVPVEEITGDPAYVEDGVLEDGIQATTGGVVLIQTTSDVGYSVPIDAPVDDGLVFPLTYRDAVVVNETRGGTTSSAIDGGVTITQPPPNQSPAEQGDSGQSVQTQLTEFIKNTATYHVYEIKPVTNGPFETIYLLDTVPVPIPKQIDLGAAS